MLARMPTISFRSTPRILHSVVVALGIVAYIALILVVVAEIAGMI